MLSRIRVVYNDTETIYMNCVYITLFSFWGKSMSDGGTQHSLLWKIRDNSMFLSEKADKIQTHDRCVAYFHTVLQCLNGHHIILDQFVEARNER